MRGRQIRFPIGAKILVGQMAIIFAFLATQAVVLWAVGMPLYAKFIDVYHEATAEALPFSRLQGEIFHASFLLNRYSVDPSPQDRAEFRRTVDNVNAKFSYLQHIPFEIAEEAELLQTAKQHWDQVYGAGLLLVALGSPASPETMPVLHRFNGNVVVAIRAIERFNEIAAQEMEESRLEVETSLKKGLVVFFAALGLWVAGTTVIGILMWRAIARPLRLLRSRAQAISGGDWGRPILWPSRDEFAELAQSFNAMASSLSSQKKALEDLAYQDALTGVLTRRAILGQCGEELDRARRYNRLCSVVMIDIDYFKAVNDGYGHSGGDEVLRQVAERLSRTLRTTDRVGRYGGEEFIVILPETDETTAVAIADRLRQLVGATPISLADGRETTVTISAGVATFPTDAPAPDELVHVADLALYAAKQGGRNRVCLAERAAKG